MQISKAMIFWAENHEKIADSFAISQLSVITLSDSKRFIEPLRNLPLKNFEVDNTKNERRIFRHWKDKTWYFLSFAATLPPNLLIHQTKDYSAGCGK